MAVESLSMEHVTIRLPQVLLQHLQQKIPSQDYTSFITQAIKTQLSLVEQMEAIEESAGSWSLENHPMMVDEAGIDAWLRELRTGK